MLTLLCTSCATVRNSPRVPVVPATAPANQSTLTLQNNLVQLIVDPRIGRIVYFGRLGGPNLLWIDADAPATAAREKGALAQWMNWGGDKLWWGPQALWVSQIGRRWPPDDAFDGQPWNVLSHDRNQVVIESRESNNVGGRFRRTITLHPAEPIVDFDNVFLRTQTSAIPIQMWSVTQVVTPAQCLLDMLPSAPAGPFPIVAMGPPLNPPPQVLEAGTMHWMQFSPAEQPETKIGTFGNWIAAISGDAFVQISPYQQDKPYLERSSIQAYKNPKFVEIETVSPLFFPRVGEMVHHSVRWCLLKNADTPAATVQAIGRLSKPD